MKKYFNVLLVSLMLFVLTPVVNADEVVPDENTDVNQGETITDETPSETPDEEVPKTIVLEAPTFTISNSYYTSLKLTWTHNNEDVTGYKIYRATSKSGKYSLIKTVTVGDTAVGEKISYTNTKRTFNKTYYYKIRAYHKAEDGKITYSKYSSVKSKKVLTPAPTTTGTYTSFLKNKITWKKVTGASGYAVYKLVNGKYVLQKSTTSLSYTETLKNSTTKLQLSNSYKVRAYRKVSGKKVYGPYSPVMTIENKLTVPKLTYTSIDHTSYKLTGNTISGATSYELYSCADEACAEEGRTLVVNEAKLSEVINVESMADKQYFVVRAVRTIKGESIYSDYSAVYTFSAKPAKVEVGSSSKFDKEAINNNTIAFMVLNTDSNNKYEFVTATSKTGTYKTSSNLTCQYTIDYLVDYYIDLVAAEGEELTEEDIAEFREYTLSSYPEYEYSYYCEHNNLNAGKTYYYKVRTVRTENEVDYYGEYSDIVSVKVAPSKVASVGTRPYKYNSTMVMWDEVTGADGYQVYRATSKNGKYTLVKTTTGTSYTHTGTLNKTYYYKVRAYFINKDGKKVYGSFSSIKSRKLKALTGIDKYPVELDGNNITAIVKSTSATKKSTTSSNVIYKFKVNYTKTWASQKTKGYYTVNFYDWNYNKVYSYTLYATVPKGTKRNYSVTFDIKVPKTAVYYEFI